MYPDYILNQKKKLTAFNRDFDHLTLNNHYQPPQDYAIPPLPSQSLYNASVTRGLNSLPTLQTNFLQLVYLRSFYRYLR